VQGLRGQRAGEEERRGGGPEYGCFHMRVGWSDGEAACELSSPPSSGEERNPRRQRIDESEDWRKGRRFVKSPVAWMATSSRADFFSGCASEGNSEAGWKPIVFGKQIAVG
jgi:hypothetical protein